jgi:hypothetical protein
VTNPWFARTFKPIQPCQHDATRLELGLTERRLICTSCGTVVETKLFKWPQAAK